MLKILRLQKLLETPKIQKLQVSVESWCRTNSNITIITGDGLRLWPRPNHTQDGRNVKLPRYEIKETPYFDEMSSIRFSIAGVFWNFFITFQRICLNRPKMVGILHKCSLVVLFCWLWLFWKVTSQFYRFTVSDRVADPDP